MTLYGYHLQVSYANPTAQLSNAVDALETWPETLHLADADEIVEEHEQDLHRVAELVRSRAPEPELHGAVRRALDHGWSWGPIALLLDITQQEAQRRFGEL